MDTRVMETLMPIKEMTVEEFFTNNELGVDIFRKKYIKNPEDTVNQCFRNICEEIASVDIETDKEKWITRWVDELMNDMWRPGGSIIAATNNPEKKISAFNCTTVGLRADNLEAIYQSRYRVAKCAAYRQGVGVDFSHLRPKGVPVNNSAGRSEGAVHWMKSFNNIGTEVGQAGRIPAILGSLLVRHPDTYEVISAKDEKGNIENMNISIQITDDFIQSVKKDEDWQFKFKLKEPFTFPTVKAVKLFDDICEHAWISGDPGLQFIDKMKGWSIQEALGENIISTNACCFTEDMIVSTNQGKKTIAELRTIIASGNNDILIKSFNIANLEVEFKSLEDVHTRENGEPQQLVELEIENVDGSIKTIKCTPDHKFFTENRGWIEAKDLTEEDDLV